MGRDKEENLAEQSQKTIPDIGYVSHCKHCTNGHSLKMKERPVYQSKHSHKGRQESKGIGGFGVPEYLVPYRRQGKLGQVLEYSNRL